MIKCAAGDVLMFGLSAMNLDQLKKGRPIDIDLRHLGLDRGRVVIFYGETEQSMLAELVKHGLVPSDFMTQPGGKPG
ncbi:MAG TPA: hypothetical protein VGQ52_13790 [Gemmatimonadaceae bacterium]|jgi:hypothetical protein|nr:hypothetical protein [Gemmatimonadaceae bacterium]